MSQHNLNTSYPKAGISGQFQVDPVRMDAIADSVAELAKRADKIAAKVDCGPDNTLTTPNTSEKPYTRGDATFGSDEDISEEHEAISRHIEGLVADMEEAKVERKMGDRISELERRRDRLQVEMDNRAGYDAEQLEKQKEDDKKDGKNARSDSERDDAEHDMEDWDQAKHPRASGGKFGASQEDPNAAKMEEFTGAQLHQLREEYSRLKTIDPSSPHYRRLIGFLGGLDQHKMKQLSKANIPFISSLARNRVKGDAVVRTDPPVSEAQRRWAWANEDKPGAEGAAAKKFAEADPGGKLPERK